MNSWDSTPTRFVERPGKEPLEVFRCETDGGLVTMSQDSLRRHAGHRMRQPVLLRDDERKAIEEGKIE